jgi:hypothetical protein
MLEICSNTTDTEDYWFATADSDLQHFTIGIKFLMRIPG